MRPWTDLPTIETPAHIARLARDARGYPIPHMVQMRSDGTPDFRVVDPRETQRARLRPRLPWGCTICCCLTFSRPEGPGWATRTCVMWQVAT
jgi:hypothetical protein